MATATTVTPYCQVCIISNGYHIYRIGIAIGGAALGTQYIYASEIKRNRGAAMA
jgi:hypothetical protein